uniref:RING-type E3 ubiquitin transferase n=1 Tax=Davidia involucrata TaxID=16924 RepID=A0A5B7ADK6_DAVIN
MKPHSRKLLQDEDALQTTLLPSTTYSPDPLLQPMNNGTSSMATRLLKPNNSHFDSSMALTILVLLVALFFMGFFSIYIRRFSDDSAVDISRRRQRHNGPPPPQTSSRSNPHKGGLDPSAVRSLPLIPYGGDAKHPIDCSICLSEFEERETVKLIPYCRHVFHQECIDTWLSSHVSCPLCRSTRMMFAVDEEESGLGTMQSQGGSDHGVV